MMDDLTTEQRLIGEPVRLDAATALRDLATKIDAMALPVSPSRTRYPSLAILADDGMLIIDVAVVGEFRAALDELDHSHRIIARLLAAAGIESPEPGQRPIAAARAAELMRLKDDVNALVAKERAAPHDTVSLKLHDPDPRRSKGWR